MKKNKNNEVVKYLLENYDIFIQKRQSVYLWAF